MDEHEIALAQELGLEVSPVRKPGHSHSHTFALPCPRHQGGRCSTYGRRPTVCEKYECRLLRRYLRCEVSLGQAQDRVVKIEAELDALAQHLGPRGAGQAVWDWIESWREAAGVSRSEEARRQHAMPLLRIGVLAVLKKREFDDGESESM